MKTEPRGGEYIDFPVVPKEAPFKPNKQYYVEMLAEGVMVGIHDKREYPTFFKLFQRYTQYHRLPLRLYLRQVEPTFVALSAGSKIRAQASDDVVR